MMKDVTIEILTKTIKTGQLVIHSKKEYFNTFFLIIVELPRPLSRLVCLVFRVFVS